MPLEASSAVTTGVVGAAAVVSAVASEGASVALTAGSLLTGPVSAAPSGEQVSPLASGGGPASQTGAWAASEARSEASRSAAALEAACASGLGVHSPDSAAGSDEFGSATGSDEFGSATGSDEIGSGAGASDGSEATGSGTPSSQTGSCLWTLAPGLLTRLT